MKIIYIILLSIIIFLAILLKDNYLKYDELKEQTNHINNEILSRIKEKEVIEEHITQILKQRENLQTEKESLFKEYEIWKQRSEKIKSHL
ncbi:hypothetical protein [Campylobacter geochelonis]|uniref:hypothetical protein n=1 Tax=Campylobacter geochelonis TaxID=1780362 RepID=UPI000770AC65|nr:hypothetical protein [Campylobacter geochelonis]CZE50909.1 Uncharacterised protein [Campylobacter geochelonis]